MRVHKWTTKHEVATQFILFIIINRLKCSIAHTVVVRQNGKDEDKKKATVICSPYEIEVLNILQKQAHNDK